MVEHYRKVVEKAAEHKIMVIVHEPIKATGIRRTWPNMISREGARGQEYNAWSGDGGNPPDHTTILPFTRLLGGPFDFTPGIFDLFFTEAGRPKNRVNTTLAKQLALYVVIYSPMQMAADLPENYEGNPAFEFIKTVPSDWETTLAIHAKIGDFVTIARKERGGEDWFIGSITDEDGRTLEAQLSFLDAGREYEAYIFADGRDADWKERPYLIDIRKERVDSSSILKLELAPGGGQAVRLSPVNPSAE
jgi:alpha-glucosidase